MNLLKFKDTPAALRGNDVTDIRSFSSPREFIWLILLPFSSLVFSLGFACATPLAAFGALAAVALSKRDGLILCGAVWLVNQVVGYTLLQYSWNINSVSWALALGGATILAFLSSRWIYRRSKTHYLFRLIAAFIAAFAVFQVSLYLVELFVLGELQDSAADIVIRVLAINAAAFVGLLALHWLAVTVGFISAAAEAHARHPSPARRAVV
jgi:hypothetical protein